MEKITPEYILEKHARPLAEWYLRNMTTRSDNDSNSGQLPYEKTVGKSEFIYASQWNLGFSMMGMLSAARVFQDNRYQEAADAMAAYLRSVQIFDPFHPEHYGALREGTSQTAWGYVRDGLSCAWGFIEYYDATGCDEFLKRAILWGEWFLKQGLDETGWPLWGILFDPIHPTLFDPQIRNDIHGCFQGGGLNFFYRLYRATGDKKWVGPFFEHIADYFCRVIQQPDGFFRSVEKSTGKVPANDPQNGLHRGNDDLGTLGLLCAWRIYQKPEYLQSIRRFLEAVFKKQAERTDHQFEQSCAAVPVILNVLHESQGILDFMPPEGACDEALEALFSRQFGPENGDAFTGAIDEQGNQTFCLRSMGYTLLYLLKKYGGDNRFLTAKQ